MYTCMKYISTLFMFSVWKGPDVYLYEVYQYFVHVFSMEKARCIHV